MAATTSTRPQEAMVELFGNVPGIEISKMTRSEHDMEGTFNFLNQAFQQQSSLKLDFPPDFSPPNDSTREASFLPVSKICVESLEVIFYPSFRLALFLEKRKRVVGENPFSTQAFASSPPEKWQRRIVGLFPPNDSTGKWLGGGEKSESNDLTGERLSESLGGKRGFPTTRQESNRWERKIGWKVQLHAHRKHHSRP